MDINSIANGVSTSLLIGLVVYLLYVAVKITKQSNELRKRLEDKNPKT